MQVRTDYGLTEDKVKCAPGLDRALSNFAASLPMPQPTSNGLAKHDVTLVTDGPLQAWKDAVHFAVAKPIVGLYFDESLCFKYKIY